MGLFSAGATANQLRHDRIVREAARAACPSWNSGMHSHVHSFSANLRSPRMFSFRAVAVCLPLLPRLQTVHLPCLPLLPRLVLFPVLNLALVHGFQSIASRARPAGSKTCDALHAPNLHCPQHHRPESPRIVVKWTTLIINGRLTSEIDQSQGAAGGTLRLMARSGPPPATARPRNGHRCISLGLAAAPLKR